MDLVVSGKIGLKKGFDFNKMVKVHNFIIVNNVVSEALQRVLPQKGRFKKKFLYCDVKIVHRFYYHF